MTVIRCWCFYCKQYVNVTPTYAGGFFCPICEAYIGCVMVPYSEGGPK